MTARKVTMHAIVLAAGRGSRLEHLTDKLPKCLVEYSGRPLIDGAIEALRNGGIEHITVVAGYRAETLQSRVHAGGIDELIVNDQWETTNMVASLLRASPLLERERTLVSYGDLFYGAKIVNDLRNAVDPLAVGYDPEGVALWIERFEDPLDDLEDFQIETDGRMTKVGSRVKSTAQPQGQYMGLLSVSPNAFAAMKETIDPALDATLDMTSLIQRVIDSGFPVAGIRNYEAWGEIDNPADLAFFTSRATTLG